MFRYDFVEVGIYEYKNSKENCFWLYTSGYDLFFECNRSSTKYATT